MTSTNGTNFIDTTTSTDSPSSTSIITQFSTMNLNDYNNSYNSSNNGYLINNNNSNNSSSSALSTINYLPPPRTSFGTEGKVIRLRANHFIMSIQTGYLYQYSVNITPDKCPKRINR